MGQPAGLPPLSLVEALRVTADRIAAGATFRWTHMGSCHCGHLAQTVTQKSHEELHRLALEKAGDWGAQALDHCPASGLPIDHVIDALFALGLRDQDLFHLERLDDPRVLARFPAGERELDFRRREDSVRYFRAWADLLEEKAAKERAPLDAAPVG